MKRNMFRGLAELEAIVIVGLLIIGIAVWYVKPTAPKHKTPKPVPAATKVPAAPEAPPAVVPAPVPAPAAAPVLPKIVEPKPAPAAVVPVKKVTATPAASCASPVTVNVNEEKGVLGALFTGRILLPSLSGSVSGIEVHRGVPEDGSDASTKQ